VHFLLQLKRIDIQVNFIDGYDMTGVARSFVYFQDLKSGRIHSTAVALQDSEALADFQLNLRPEFQIHGPMAGLYFVVIKHI
jgi:hypothetical protein